MRPFDIEATALAERKWTTERRAGVEHYKAGQHAAVRCADEERVEVFCLAYVPQHGHGIMLLPVARERGSWKTLDLGLMVGGSIHDGGIPIPSSFRFTTPMLVALEQARRDSERR